ncbi:serine hydrolase domain-containing protein [Algoriphagus hitonicola]|uniref:CubicO group peptidase, beta-lactamase class C family n=1 Tax=Algoriphagus hitonicola TaxID=435880 RepID=A0A1I2T570_9BACT|nr:serine hydrolase [Algoriphagus hitonicola]SFG57361.1 CubicO group peptidase, beta-lactamase class C family [Algoriphagus hitonicola]
MLYITQSIISNFIRKIGIIFPILCILSCKTSNVKNTNENKFTNDNLEFSQKFHEKIVDIFKEKELEGDFIFAIVGENGLLYSKAINNKIINGESSFLDNNSPIYVASHTKSFTGTLAKILEEKGKIDLNKSLSNYLPELNFKDSIDVDKIFIKNLLNHTHGTFSTTLTWKTAFLGYSGNNSELIEDFNNDFLYDPSGSFRYSNVGPIITAIAIESATGNSWKDEMKEHIFQPLEMFNTTTKVSDLHYDRIRPSVTVSKEHGVIETGFDKSDILMHASGGVISTVNDLSKWLSANIRQDNILLSQESWKELHTSNVSQDKSYFTYNRKGYSLGWDIAEYQGDTILTRFGGLAGISFHISFIPEKKIGIIAFSSDNRAYILPHLMANYAYNELNENLADSIFQIERINFEKAFDNENALVYPNKTQLLTQNETKQHIQGSYLSTSGWPPISINQEADHFIFNWGVLNGKIFKTEDGHYTSNLGLLNRDFEIKSDTLKTGSLIYIKIKQ